MCSIPDRLDLFFDTESRDTGLFDAKTKHNWMVNKGTRNSEFRRVRKRPLGHYWVNVLDVMFRCEALLQRCPQPQQVRLRGWNTPAQERVSHLEVKFSFLYM